MKNILLGKGIKNMKEVFRQKKYHASFSELCRLVRGYSCEAVYRAVAKQNSWHPLGYRYAKKLHRKPYKEA